MWQFMKGTAQGLRAAGRLVGGRAPRSVSGHRRRGPAPQRSEPPVRLPLPGGGGVQRRRRQGVARARARLPDEDDADSLNSDATFFRLYDTKLLRRETKDYVPKLIAAALIAKEPARYGFTVPAAEPPTYDSIVVPGMTGLDVIARLADTTVAAIRELNPQYLRLATPPSSKAVVRLPSGRGPMTETAYAELPVNRRVTFVEHTVSRGETMSGIAHRYRVSVAPAGGGQSEGPGQPAQARPADHRPDRRRALHLGGPPHGRPGGARVQQPRAAFIACAVARRSPGSRSSTVSPSSSSGNGTRWANGRRDPRRPAAAGDRADQRARSHRVRRGETLAGLAKRYGVSVQALSECESEG